MTNTNSRRKALTSGETKKIVRRRSVIYTYTLKELKLIFRSPMYFMNCVMVSFIWPILFLIPVLGGITNGSGSESFSIKEMLGTGELLTALSMLAVFGITIVVTSMNFTTGTSISREGKNFFVMKYIPVSYEKQIFAKILSGIVITVFSATIYLLVAMFIFKLSLFIIVVSTIISFFTGIIFNYLQIIVDLIKPKLNWENEQAAIKQNFNTIIELVFTFIVGGGLCLIGILCYVVLGLSAYTIGISACVILLIITLIIHRLVTHFGAKRLYSLE